MTTKKIHNLFVYLSFFIPFILYFLTMAPTVSLWDCGEFISTSVIMGVPHPPGTPLYLIISNFFSQIPIFSDIGARVNLVSPIASALSVMFLYMSIVYLIEEFQKEKNESLIKNYAAFIGAMTFAITDSHWFNSVESEVYALSTFFTAIVVWLILKWAKNFNEKFNIKYLILIAYCLGLAIGIHLLNLLAIPFIALIIFFKYKKISFYNIFVLMISTGSVFVVIYLGIIKGLPSIANKTNSVVVVILFILITAISTIISNINFNKNLKIIKHIFICLFSFMVLFLTINQIFVTDYKEMLLTHKRDLGEYANLLIREQDQLYEKFVSAPTDEARQFHLLDLIKYNMKLEVAESFIQDADTKIELYDVQGGINYFELIKKQNPMYMSFGLLMMLLIMSGIVVSYNNIKNNTSNYYGISRIIINATLMIVIGYSTYSLIFIRAQQNPKINYNNPHDVESAYEYINRDQYGQWSIWDREKSLLVNTQGNNESWKRYTHNTKDASFNEVTNFIWNYQFKEMYLRYFAWQFIGKEVWEDRSWNRNSLDNEELISLPPLQGVDWTRYGLPLAFLIGLIGFIYQLLYDWRRWLSVNALFILTGLAIVLYLNQSDPQPRERDYAYVGSFFSFSIWIGIGCYALISKLEEILNFNKKIYNQYITSIIASILFIMMPLLMGARDYYEHDRSNRYEAWDYAYNLLNSCEPDAILFTNGDNDTFPLWYIQEVEKIRTDVKVVNLSLLNFPSYVSQLDEHKPSLNMFEENNEYIKIVQSENYEKLMDYAVERWIVDGSYTININTNKKTNFEWRFRGGTYGLGLTNFTIMQIIETCFDERPIYFSTTTGTNNLGLHKYLVQEGLVYKLVNEEYTGINDNELVKTLKRIGLIRHDEIQMDIEQTMKMITKSGNEPFIDNDGNGIWNDAEEFTDLDENGIWDSEFIIKTKEDYIQHQKWLEKYPEIGTYRYTNLDRTGVYYGPNIERLAANYRNVFFKTATNLILNDQDPKYIEKSFNVLDLSNRYYPNTVIPIETAYNYAALGYCQLVLQIASYKMINEDATEIEKMIGKMENKIGLLLSTVDQKLVEKYFPEFLSNSATE